MFSKKEVFKLVSYALFPRNMKSNLKDEGKRAGFFHVQCREANDLNNALLSHTLGLCQQKSNIPEANCKPVARIYTRQA